YEPVLEGGYQIIVPALPEIISFGRTLNEARKMAKEAIECVLEGMQKEQILPPRDLKIKPLTEKVLVSV
ncbi:MAG: type II toxin-antitoxin system HicB family antitoxin, partial [Patescibacteria group bacterium]